MTANFIKRLTSSVELLTKLLTPGTDDDSDLEQPVTHAVRDAREHVWQPEDDDLTLTHGDPNEGVWTIKFEGDDLRGVPQRARAAVAEHEAVAYANLISEAQGGSACSITVKEVGDDE